MGHQVQTRVGQVWEGKGAFTAIQEAMFREQVWGHSVLDGGGGGQGQIGSCEVSGEFAPENSSLVLSSLDPATVHRLPEKDRETEASVSPCVSCLLL